MFLIGFHISSLYDSLFVNENFNVLVSNWKYIDIVLDFRHVKRNEKWVNMLEGI